VPIISINMRPWTVISPNHGISVAPSLSSRKTTLDTSVDVTPEFTLSRIHAPIIAPGKWINIASIGRLRPF
jgi:hypothetical protein